MRPYILFVAAFIAISACNTPAATDTEAHTVVTRLIGNWEFIGTDLTERWEQVDPNHFRGTVNRSFNGELEPAQYIDLTFDQDSLTYVGTVLGAHNSMRPIRFGLESCTQDHLKFKNLNQDFPMFIEYLMISQDTFQVKMSGTQDDKYREQSFNYKRIQ